VDRKERIALNLGDLVKKADEKDSSGHKVATAA